jgi:hypothetical protein
MTDQSTARDERVGKVLRLAYGRGTQYARIEAVRTDRRGGVKLRIRRLEGLGTSAVRWNVETSEIATTDKRIIGEMVDRVPVGAPPPPTVADLEALVASREAEVAKAEADLATARGEDAAEGASEFRVSNAVHRVRYRQSDLDAARKALELLRLSGL